ILAPVIAATELSQDLASEVALRTREVEAQRNFAARIIDSLPVGLYVIDRSYVIRAWNRKRESGTQGVAREDAVGREIFEVLDRQPRELLKREFDRVFDTGELQQVEMESARTSRIGGSPSSASARRRSWPRWASSPRGSCTRSTTRSPRFWRAPRRSRCAPSRSPPPTSKPPPSTSRSSTPRCSAAAASWTACWTSRVPSTAPSARWRSTK